MPGPGDAGALAWASRKPPGGGACISPFIKRQVAATDPLPGEAEAGAHPLAVFLPVVPRVVAILLQVECPRAAVIPLRAGCPPAAVLPVAAIVRPAVLPVAPQAAVIHLLAVAGIPPAVSHLADNPPAAAIPPVVSHPAAILPAADTHPVAVGILPAATRLAGDSRPAAVAILLAGNRPAVATLPAAILPELHPRVAASASSHQVATEASVSNRPVVTAVASPRQPEAR
jgi:hypothetical protein